MGMYSYYEIKINGNTSEIERLYTDLNCLKNTYADSNHIDENLAKSKDNELIGTIFYYGMEKDEITKNSNSYSDSITWEKISYEYYLYEKFKIDPPKPLFGVQSTYNFSLKTIKLDYIFKKSLKQNNIQNLDDYFHFYEKEYNNKFDFDTLKQLFNDSTYTFSRWWVELLFPLLDSDIEKTDKEITIKFSEKFAPYILFERLSKKFDVVILVSDKFEEYNRPTYSYYYKGYEVNKKTYNDRLANL